MATSATFVPAQPPRVPDWLPGWRAMTGERLRSVVHGIAEPAFDVWHQPRQFLNMDLHIVNAPDMIGHVLLDNHSNYVRPRQSRQILKPLIGNGLLSAVGEDWRKQRKIVAPTFAPGAVAGMAALMADATRDAMRALPAESARVDMAELATDTTMAIIAKTLFSGDPRLMSHEASAHIGRLIASAAQPRLMRILGLQDFDPSPSMIRARRSRRWLRRTLADLVRERGPSGGADDFFGGFMRALYADLPPSEAEELAVDNAITFYVAGHETTATALSWACYVLAGQPELQEEARAEAVAALGGDIATLADRLPLLRQILDETMRLYPSALQLIREAVADDDMLGVPVRKGELVFVYPWVVHRHRKLWDDPDRFDHNRFAPEKKAALHRFQYIPFGVGPRICVGARFAITEALIVLANWLSARRLALPHGFQPIPYGNITLRPKHGMPLVVSPL
ncbi:cytochrome P450 [Sphingopyxis sp. KK2]|uniref:cytochrome P450 n=1 Tax=Sphingopyxis sp. KK2 TaxID=1855727 RepID=UPI00097E73F4|nr:cytochrome P450 [Sphingopyxis sp. KK2]